MKTSENVYVVTATVAAVSRVSRTNALFLSATNLSAPPPGSDDDTDRATLTSATDVPIDSDADVFPAPAEPTEPFGTARLLAVVAVARRSPIVPPPFARAARSASTDRRSRRSASASALAASYLALPPRECSADL